MSITVQIPTPLRRFTNEEGEVQVEADTVGEALRDLVARHQELERHLYDEEGRLRSFVNVFLNDEDVRFLDRESTSVKSGDTLTLIPSIAGGRP